MSRPDLLYVSPIMPALTGNGLAMRAAMVLEALAVDHNVHLVVVPVCDPSGRPRPAPELSQWCAGIAVVEVTAYEHPLFRLAARSKDPRERLAAYQAYPKPSMYRFATAAAVGEVTRAFPPVTFSVIHVFRLYLAPFVESYVCARPGSRPTCTLDLDDHESGTARRLAALHKAAGDEVGAAFHRSESEKFAAMERATLPRFDRVYVSSEADRLKIARQCKDANLVVLPNAVRLPAARPPQRRPGAPFTFLFVGNLGYYPNDDAAVFFCREVLPRLTVRARRRVLVMIVGAHPSRRVQALSAVPDVTVTGPVPDVAPYYHDADVVVVPVRAGGGTRIKLLEAFSHGRPAVATTIGAEGIDARAGVELLLADGPDEFAARCAELMRRPALRRRLAIRAFDFVSTRHSPSRVLDVLRQDLAPSALKPGARASVARMEGQGLVTSRPRRQRSRRPGPSEERRHAPLTYRNETRNDQWLVEHVFPGKRGGYFVEAGAADGLGGSACYVLERQLEWTGLCIEPNDAFFERLVVNRPNSIHENVCLASASGRVPYIEGSEDTVSPFLGGIKSNLQENKCGGRVVVEKGREAEKRAETLADLLDKHGAPTVIDYAGFDIEGSEFEVLSSFPFDRYTFLSMTIECDEVIWERLRPILQAHGYIEVRNSFNADMPWERYLLHESIGQKRGESGRETVRVDSPAPPFPIAGYFCINLEHRTDRQRAFVEQMAETRARWIAPIEENIRRGVRYGSFSEIGRRIPPLAPYLKARPETTQLGTIGCYHAHIRVLEEIAARNTDRWYVVFEDDVRIRSADWLTVLGGLRLPAGHDDTDLVLVDLCGRPLAKDRIGPGWFRMSQTFPAYHGSHCYVVLGSRAARSVLKALARWPYVEDIDGLMVKCGRSLAWYPRLVDLRWMGSDRVR